MKHKNLFLLIIIFTSCSSYPLVVDDYVEWQGLLLQYESWQKYIINNVDLLTDNELEYTKKIDKEASTIVDNVKNGDISFKVGIKQINPYIRKMQEISREIRLRKL